jgi:hypothetical protein
MKWQLSQQHILNVCAKRPALNRTCRGNGQLHLHTQWGRWRASPTNKLDAAVQHKKMAMKFKCEVKKMAMKVGE